MKRRLNSGGSVTGGTGDVKPQVLTLFTGFTNGGPNEYAVQRVILPVARFGNRKNTTTVMEFLTLDWYINVLDRTTGGRTDWAFLSTNSTHITDETTSLNKSLVDIRDPQSIGLVFQTFSPSAGTLCLYFNIITYIDSISSWGDSGNMASHL